MSIPDLPINFSAPALPEELKLITQLLIEGRVCDLIILATTTDGMVIDGVFTELDGNKPTALVMLGALEVVKRDWMRSCIEARVEYVEIEEDTGEAD